MAKRPQISQAAAAARSALKQEKLRFDTDEAAKFSALKNDATQKGSRFPRTLARKTFFTPHLARRTGAGPNDKLARQYAVILELHGQPTVSLTPYNPVRHHLDSLSELPALPTPPILAKVHQLEKAGYRFTGTNKDILVFEKLYNPKQLGQQWAKRSAIIITTSVVLATGMLFAGEFFT